ncbi:hypothetical protein M569_05292, partial [Genlisea aurea]
ESMIMVFDTEFQNLHDNGSEGHVDEQRIFSEVFFDSCVVARKGFLFPEAPRVDNDDDDYDDDAIIDRDACSNSGMSSLTTHNDFADLGKRSCSVKSLDEDITGIRNSAVTAGIVSDMPPEKTASSCAVEFCVVESYGKCITSSRYQPSMNEGKRKNKVRSVDRNEQKETLTGGVCSPISQESYASKLIVTDLPVSIANNLQSQSQAKHKWKDSCFIELNEEEFARPENIKNDPRPLLRYHIHRLLRAAGWLIGRRKRNNKYKGNGEYVYKSPVGRPIREFYRAWRICGEHLRADVVSSTLITLLIAAKYPKISRSERSSNLTAGSLQDSENHENYPCGLHLSNIRVDLEENEVSASPETVFTNKVSLASCPCLEQAESAGDITYGRMAKTKKKSRKLFEMHHGNHFIDKGCHHVCEISSSSKSASKRSKCDSHDDEVLISALKKTRKGRPTKKGSKHKPKLVRKQKSPKGSCRLLPRGGKSVMEAKWSTVESRTVLSWMIHSGVISINDVIQYRNIEYDAVIKDGIVTRDGILCSCCHKVLSVSEFKFHAGFRSDHPCMNLFLESGRPLISCQLDAWSTEFQSRQVASRINQDDEIDQNDDSCGRCGDVGELICCDNCPSAFHQGCLFEQEVLEGNWYCPRCRCKICGDVVTDKEEAEASQVVDDLKCAQCCHKYHRSCLREKHSEIVLSSEAWFCGDSCRKVEMGLQSRVGLKNYIGEGLCWSLLRCISDESALKAECNSKLAVAITIMEECFVPMVDTRTGISMIPQVIFNW